MFFGGEGEEGEREISDPTCIRGRTGRSGKSWRERKFRRSENTVYGAGRSIIVRAVIACLQVRRHRREWMPVQLHWKERPLHAVSQRMSSAVASRSILVLDHNIAFHLVFLPTRELHRIRNGMFLHTLMLSFFHNFSCSRPQDGQI